MGGYPAMSGFIAMCSVLAVVGIEMVFAVKGAGHNHSVDLEQLRGDSNPRPKVGRSESSNSFRHEPLGQYDELDAAVPLQEHSSTQPGSTDTPETLNKPLPPEPPFQDDDSDPDLDELDPMVADDDRQPLTIDDADEQGGHSNGHLRNPSSRRHRKVSFADPPTTHSHTSPTTQDTAHEQRAVLQCLMLEAGILFHSVFIGMALSVSTGAAFVVLLVAIFLPPDLRRPRPRQQDRRDFLVPAQQSEAMVDERHVRRHYSHRPSHRVGSPPSIRPGKPVWIVDGRYCECYLQWLAPVCRTGAAARGGFPNR